MKKKTLLVLSITLIAFLAFLPGAGSVSADSDDYYYAYGKWPTDKSPGVYGHNYVYDNDVYTGHVAEYVVVRLSNKPLLWVQVGWLKRQGWNKAKFYVEWKFEEDHAPIEYFGDAEYNSSHNYKILRSGNYWDVYIDDARVEHLYTTKW